MEKDDALSKRLCLLAAAMMVGCLGVASAGFLRSHGLIRVPDIPYPWGSILLWAFLAFSILFGLDRGAPSTGVWGIRLRWTRLGLLFSCVAAVAVVIYK